VGAEGRRCTARMARVEARLSPATARQMRLVLFGAAVVGLLIGLNNVVLHVSKDPLADVRAYYDAGARLNAGAPLYVQSVDTNDAGFYRYPPLLAIAFRPLALLPWPLAAAIWETFLVVGFALTIRRLGPRLPTWVALGMLAMPIAWSLVVGQAQVLVTALLVVGAPWAVALAAHLKLLPALVALYWLGRRDWESLARFAAWAVVLAAVQLLLEPAATVAFLGFSNLAQVGAVNNLSIYALSPPLWAALVVAGGIATLRLAPTRYGWAAAIALSVLATPRLLAYQLSTLLAGLRSPDRDAE
jgi:Glycosyltransferase family 87